MHHSGGACLVMALEKDFQPMTHVEVVALLMQTMEVFQPTGHRLMKNLQIHVFKPFKTTSITQGVMVALMTCQYTKAPEEE